jgi:phage I-like protein
MAALGSSIAIQSAIGNDNTQWVHVLPAGRVFGSDGRGPYELADAEAVMQRSRQYHGKKQMVVDYEHQSINTAKNGKPAPAAGWISGLKAEKDGLWALVTWTAQAADLIRSKSYRYLSPVFNYQPDGKITMLKSVGLTNSPNLDLTALARSEDFSMNETELTELRALLGLSPGADFAPIRDAINALKTSVNASNPDPSQFVPIGDFERVVADANKLRQGVTVQAAETHVGDCIRSGKLAPFMRDWAIALCTTNKPAFDGFIERTGPAFVAMTTQAQIAGQPGGRQSALTESEQAVCSTMGLTEEEFIKGRAAE